MLHLEFQRAKFALQAGRLEEVIERLDREEVRKHRRGQELLDEVVEALLKRGWEHLDAQRYHAAQADAENGIRLAGRRGDVIALVEEIKTRTAQVKRGQVAGLVGQATSAYQSGRLDLLFALETDLLKAESALGGQESLQDHSSWDNKAQQGIEGALPNLRDVLQQIQRCRKVSNQLAMADFHAAHRQLQLLARCYDDGGWVTEAMDHVAAITPRWDALCAGPMGLVVPANLAKTTGAFMVPKPSSRQVKANRPIEPNRSHLLQIDGLGSLLIFPGSQITFAGVGQTVAADVHLQTEAVASPLVIRRSSADYWAESSSAFQVNQKITRQVLLSDQDAIQIGRRGRIRFHKKVTASESAVLQLTTAGMSRGDIRHIVLLSDSLLFGPEGCHFKVPGLRKPVILAIENGQLNLRMLGTSDRTVELDKNQPATIESTRFYLSEFSH